jgi:hypothetical protein
MSDLELHLLKVAGFTCLMIVPFLFAGWIAHRILDRPWRVTRWRKFLWQLKRRSTMAKRRERSGLWLLILMTWDLMWWRPPKEG